MLNFHQSLSFLNWIFPLLHFPQEFPARISRKIFLQELPARISHIFLQQFPTRFSRNIFPQDFPARISHKNFLQDFPELDTDWLAPHHPFPNAKFQPITVFLKLAFSPPPFPTRISCNNFPQQFPARFSCKIFLSWILIGWLPITLFQMLNFHQSLSFLNWLLPLLHFPQEFPARISCKIFLQEFPARISHIFPQEFPTRFSHNIFHKIFLHEFPTRISHKIFPQEVPKTFSRNNFLQDFPELDTDWLAPHHPIPNDKFQPITVFLKLAFTSPPFRTRISCKIFPQEFPARFSRNNFPQDFPELDTDWLSPHHPILNAKFPPITAFLKLAFSPPPFPTTISCKIFPQEFPGTISCKIFPQQFPARFS